MENLEIELKLATLPESLEVIEQADFLKQYAIKPPESYPLKSIYFDTEQLELLQLGYVVRVRLYQGQYLQTIKSANSKSEGALHQRQEWHHEVAKMQPDFSAFPDPNVRKSMLEIAARNHIKALFTTHFTRTAWILSPKAGVEIELALDQGEVYTETQREPICEIELELFKGEPDDLFELAEHLKEIAQVWPESVNKAERGFRLLNRKGSE